MPRLNLNSISNTSQRLASGRFIPVPQLEALIEFGKPEQRVKVVDKVIAQAFPLSLDAAAHHLVINVIENTDNLVRARLLYGLRRKVPDMARNKIATSVLLTLIERVPATQRREIAEEFTIGVDEDELLDACRHITANLVVQKLLEYPTSAEVLIKKIQPHIVSLCAHAQGQFVVAKIITNVQDGTKIVSEALFSGDDFDDETFKLLLDQTEESCVATALLSSLYTTDNAKELMSRIIIEKAPDFINLNAEQKPQDDEDANEPTFGPARPKVGKKGPCTGKHHFLLIQLFIDGTEEEQAQLFEVLKPHLAQMCATKGQVHVVMQILKSAISEKALPFILNALREPDNCSAEDILTHQYKTLVIRTLFETRTFEQIPRFITQTLCEKSLLFCMDKCASATLQQFCQLADECTLKRLFDDAMMNLDGILRSDLGSYYLQQLFTVFDDEKRNTLAVPIIKYFAKDLHGLVSKVAGSFLMQRMIAYINDANFLKIVALFAELEEEDEEEKEELTREQKDELFKKIKHLDTKTRRLEFGTVKTGGLKYFATHPQGCHVVKALLVECKRRQLEAERKLLLNKLKPHVFEFSVNPWAGKIVLKTMFESGSKELKEAMRNVAFLKAESWFMEANEKGAKLGGTDRTMSKALRGEHVSGAKRAREVSGTTAPSKDRSASQTKKGKSKKIYKTLKR